MSEVATVAASAKHEDITPPSIFQQKETSPPGVRRFDVDDDGWLAHLESEGYVVIKECGTAAEIEQARSLLWDSLEATTPAIRDNIASWDRWRLDKRGFSMHGSVTQGKGAWMLRALPKVKAAFASIWKADDLICSMDLMLIWRPWWQEGTASASTSASSAGSTSQKWRPKTEGLHLDQNPTRKLDFACVQGMLPLYDVTDTTGGLEVVPKSHLVKEKELLLAKCGGDAMRALGDFVKFPPGYYAPGDSVLLTAKAGDLILWDSRTAHGGKVGSGRHPNDGEAESMELARLSLPICMTPRTFASDAVLRARRLMFEEGKTTNHWPHEPRVQNQVSLGYSPIVLSAAQQALL
jgi:ectoine hydroxylase-related dioxygenase (phytanoyl-CoA dioxygenase family)